MSEETIKRTKVVDLIHRLNAETNWTRTLGKEGEFLPIRCIRRAADAGQVTAVSDQTPKLALGRFNGADPDFA